MVGKVRIFRLKWRETKQRIMELLIFHILAMSQESKLCLRKIFKIILFYAKFCYSILGFAKSCSRSLNRFNLSQSMENTKFNKSYILEVLPKRTTIVKTLGLNQKARTRDSGVFFHANFQDLRLQSMDIPNV